MKRAVDHKNSSREILGKFVIVLIRLTFLFLSSNQVAECYVTVGITAFSEIKSLSLQKGMCLLFTKTQA